MMRSRFALAVAWLPLMGSLVRADDDDVVYVTDLAIFTQLAKCAQDALSMEVMSMTASKCSDDVTGLQSCVCTEKGYSTSLVDQLSSDVLASCASTASADVASVLTVLDAYCHQAATSTYTFPEPTVTVTQLIGDIAEMQYLAPCASSQLSYAVMNMADDLCPSDAAHLATCVCSQDQNSLMVSATINTMVSDACSAQTADIASAQAVYAAYCNLNNGTSSFPSATNPPGDMSYYITDIPAFWSLTGCGQTALSQAVFTQTYDLCPEGPQLLASCACIKPSMSSVVNSYITSLMSWSCSSNQVRAAASSALSIFGMYCSAARDDTTLAGITTSIAQTAPVGLAVSATGRATATGTTATATSRGGSAATTSTASSSSSSGGSGGGSGGSSSSSLTSDGSSSSSSSKSNTGVIVGAVVGGIGGLLILALAAFFVWRHARKTRDQQSKFEQLDNLAPAHGSDGLESAAAATAAGVYAGGKSELSGTPSPALSSSHAELQGRQVYEASANYAAPPAPQPTSYAELPAHQPIYQADSTPIEMADRANRASPVSAGAQSYQSGPVPQFYSELDSPSDAGRAR